MIITIIIACVVIFTLIHFGKIDPQVYQKKKELESLIAQLEKEKENLDKNFKEKSEALFSLDQALDAAVSQNNRQLELEAEKKISILEMEYRNKVSEIELKTQTAYDAYIAIKEQVEDMQAKQQAYMQMRQREEEIAQQKDYYRLVISENDLQDIKFLRAAQRSLVHKEAIDRIIWDVYYKPAYDILMSHLFNVANKVSGIYKITCIENGKVYIGQSVDLKSRFRDHIKAGLSYATATNKLYQEMQAKGVENFLFEILEETPRDRLNEREVYWIEMFDSKNNGLNKTIGGS